MLFINFDGSIHRLFLIRSKIEIETLLLGIIPIINTIYRKGFSYDKDQIKIMLKNRNAFIKEKIPKLKIIIQINNELVAVMLSPFT
jgi:hypothetical protein